MTNSEFVSEITGILKSNNKDNKIPEQLILKIGQDSASFLISQKLMDRTIGSDTNLYTTIPCIEFEKIESKKCPSIEFRLCKILMKSINPLPELIFSRLGSSIKEVVSLDGEYVFTLVDEAQYRRNKKRKYQLRNQTTIFLGTDNHLYIPEKEIYSVDATVLTLDTINVKNCSSCIDNNCKSNWDYEFICPSKLIEAVKDMTLQRLSVTRNLLEDSNPNGKENA